MEHYINKLLKSHFVGLEQIVQEFSKEQKDDSSSDLSADMSMGGSKIQNLDNLNQK